MKNFALFCLLATSTLTQTLAGDTPTSTSTSTPDSTSTPVSVPAPTLPTQEHSSSSLDSEDSVHSQNSAQASEIESSAPHKEFDNEGFITFKEYGKNLYENPRGIGCHHCHGAKGEGSIIAHYKHKGNAKTLSAPAINTLEFSAFAKALDSQKIGVMPRYYLTPKEIQAIYFYLYEGDSRE